MLKSLEAISRLRALIKEQGVKEHSALLSLLCCNAQGSGLWVFWLERIERDWDLVDLEGVAWGGPLPLIGLA